MRLSTPVRAALLLVAVLLLAPASSAQVQTIASARTAGAGAVVTVQGVVSRARGAFTQFQDATGGLSIRQTSGAFFDGVAAGTIAPGTTIQVTGTLSVFRGLLQINQGAATNDLSAFTVVGQGAAPAAQQVTLAQIAAAGEDYESELVVVRNVTTTATGTFAPGTNNPISDPSDATNAVVLRVAGANDTDIDGTAVPAGPFSLTGVVGQFSAATPPVGGYQIQPVLTSDIVPGSTAGEPGPSGGLSMAVANPVRGAAAVRFTVETAADATLALYDVLGRRVATLAEGAAQGERTAALSVAGLAPGAYVLRLSAGGRALTRVVTVVR